MPRQCAISASRVRRLKLVSRALVKKPKGKNPTKQPLAMKLRSTTAVFGFSYKQCGHWLTSY